MIEDGDNPEAVDLDAAAEEVQKARLLEELDRDGQLAQLRELLARESVRDLLWRILGRCGVYSTVYQRNFGDMALLEGKRQIGLWLLSEICEADSEAEMLMRKKANAVAHAAAEKERASREKRRRRS